MAVIELTKEFAAQKEKGEQMSNKASQSEVIVNDRVSAPHLPHPRYDKRAENTLYQGVILLANGSTIDLSAAERFRILRAKIERMNLGEKSHRVISVTSAIPQEGKSVTSVNLARALSVDPYGKTLLIDCDLRRPTVHNYFDVPREAGLSEVLAGKYLMRAVIRPVAAGLDVVTAGSMIADPTRAIEQPELAQYIEDLRQEYRYIIIDCPPVLVCSEPITLSLITDSTLLVVRAWRTQQRLVTDAVGVLGRGRIMGIVLNDGIDASKQYLDYGYYGYRPDIEAKKAAAFAKVTSGN